MGRRATGFLSAHHADPDVAVETFMLAARDAAHTPHPGTPPPAGSRLAMSDRARFGPRAIRESPKVRISPVSVT
jgi:hypothetical protein